MWKANLKLGLSSSGVCVSTVSYRMTKANLKAAKLSAVEKKNQRGRKRGCCCLIRCASLPCENTEAVEAECACVSWDRWSGCSGGRQGSSSVFEAEQRTGSSAQDWVPFMVRPIEILH